MSQTSNLLSLVLYQELYALNESLHSTIKFVLLGFNPQMLAFDPQMLAFDPQMLAFDPQMLAFDP